MSAAAMSPKAGGGGSPSSEFVMHELARLRNELKVRDGVIEERTVEVATLQKQLRLAEEGAQRAEAQRATAEDRRLSAEGQAQSLEKQLAGVRAERDALRRELDAAEFGAAR